MRTSGRHTLPAQRFSHGVCPIISLTVVLLVASTLVAQQTRRTWNLIREEDARQIIRDGISKGSVPEPTQAVWKLPAANLYARGASTSDGNRVVFASAWAGQYPLVPMANLGEISPGLLQVPTTPFPESNAAMMVFALNGIFVTTVDLDVVGNRLFRLMDSYGPWNREASIPGGTYLWHLGHAGIYLQSAQSMLLIAFREPNLSFVAKTAYLPAVSLGRGQESIVFGVLEAVEFR